MADFRKRRYLVYWVIFAITRAVHGYKKAMSVHSCVCPFHALEENDVLSESLGAASGVLRESWLPKCLLTFFIDGATSSTTVNKIWKEIGVESERAVYEVSGEELRPSSSRYASVFQNISQLHTSSRCMTLVLAAERKDFLRDALEGLVKHNVVTWPTRLLVVTRLSQGQPRQSKKLLSRLNAMVVVYEDHPEGKRFGVYAYMPYSYRMTLIASWTAKSRLKYVGDQPLFPDKFLRYDVITPPIGSWGYGYPNGSWDGLVGTALREEADFAIGPAVVLYNRALVIDYADTLMVFYIRILGRRGSTEANPWSYVMPLAPSVWAATVAALLTIFAILAVLSKISWVNVPLSPQMTPSMYIRAMLQQDIPKDTNIRWERVIYGAWLLTVLVLIEAYSANLFTLLAFRRVPEPYQSLRAVLDDPKVVMIWFGNTAYTQFFEAAESGIFKEVYEAGRRGRITYITPQEYVETANRLVSRGDHVLLHPDLAMKLFLTEDFMDKGSCKFYFSKEMLIPMAFSMMLPKYSPLREPINEGIRAAVEGGLYGHWLESTMTNPKSCKNPPTKIYVNSALSLMNTWGMFATLAAGYVIGLVIFCSEVLLGRLCAPSDGLK